jgi:hypothetical protein
LAIILRVFKQTIATPAVSVLISGLSVVEIIF